MKWKKWFNRGVSFCAIVGFILAVITFLLSLSTIDDINYIKEQGINNSQDMENLTNLTETIYNDINAEFCCSWHVMLIGIVIICSALGVYLYLIKRRVNNAKRG